MSFLLGSMRVSGQGHLEIGGCDAVRLAKEVGTPLYVLDEDHIRDRCRRLVGAFARHYPRFRVVYSAKAFLTMALARLIQEEGMGIEVVSGGELHTVLAAGFPAAEVYFTGNNKSSDELALALQAGVGRIIVDNRHELDTLARMAEELEVRPEILLRVTPGVEAHTHHFIQTGQEDSKFGFDLASGQALQAVHAARAAKSIRLVGLHCHIGSQIFDLEPFRIAAQRMIELAARVRTETELTVEELDFGGGIGIRYTEADRPPSLDEYVSNLVDTVRETAAQVDLPLPRVVIEPGRAIIGEAGTTLYTVGGSKEVSAVRTYVMVDGGMGDNPRPSLYDARYHAVVANKMNHAATAPVTVAGKCCESGDILIRDVNLPPLEPGDVLAVFSTGAYNHSMASNYNSLPRPAVVLVGAGRAELIVRRESYQDLIRRDVIPQRLEPKTDLRYIR